MYYATLIQYEITNEETGEIQKGERMEYFERVDEIFQKYPDIEIYYTCNNQHQCVTSYRN